MPIRVKQILVQIVSAAIFLILNQSTKSYKFSKCKHCFFYDYNELQFNSFEQTQFLLLNTFRAYAIIARNTRVGLTQSATAEGINLARRISFLTAAYGPAAKPNSSSSWFSTIFRPGNFDQRLLIANLLAT